MIMFECRPTSLSELTPIIFHMELINLGLEASNFSKFITEGIHNENTPPFNYGI